MGESLILGLLPAAQVPHNPTQRKEKQKTEKIKDTKKDTKKEGKERATKCSLHKCDTILLRPMRNRKGKNHTKK